MDSEKPAMITALPGNLYPPENFEISSSVTTETKEATIIQASTETVSKTDGVFLENNTTEKQPESKTAIIALALCLSVFLVALDNTIIATAIPKITDEFTSLSDVGWYGSSYLLTAAAFQLFFGKLYSFFPVKIVYLVAIGIFELGSLICGAAPTSTALIIGRAIAGLGSVGIYSGALVIVAYTVPLAKRPLYTGFIGAMYGISSIAGPLLGGAFTDNATWRWCFYINLPIGAVTIGVISVLFKPPNSGLPAQFDWKKVAVRLDLIGTLVFMPAVVCLLLSLQWGGLHYSWANWRIILLLVVFGVLATIFVAVQFKSGDNATVPIRVIRKRTVWASGSYAFSLGSAFFLVVYYLPIWFQAVIGSSAVESGVRSLPMLLGLVVLSLLSGVIVSALGYYTPWMITGTVFMSVGFGLMTTFKPDTSQPFWIAFQAIAGMGVGMGMQQPLMAVQTVLNMSDVPVGTSLILFLQTLGGSVFISVGQNIFANKLASGLADRVPGLEPHIVLSTGATNIQSSIPKELLTDVTWAYNDALAASFCVSTAMAAVSVIGALATEWRKVTEVERAPEGAPP